MSTREQREDWKSLADTWSEMITTGVNRLPAREWWAAVFPMGLEVATAMPALLADVERLEAERDAAQAVSSGLKTSWALAVRDRDANLAEIERLRARVARAREAMERAVRWGSDLSGGWQEELRAVLADAPDATCTNDAWAATPAETKASIAHSLRLVAVSMRHSAAADRRTGYIPRAEDAERQAAANLALADHIDRSIGREPPAELPPVTWVDAPKEKP